MFDCRIGKPGGSGGIMPAPIRTVDFSSTSSNLLHDKAMTESAAGIHVKNREQVVDFSTSVEPFSGYRSYREIGIALALTNEDTEKKKLQLVEE